MYDVAWGSDNRLASVGQVGGFVWSLGEGKQVAPLDGDELMRVCWHGDAVITGSSLGKMQVCSPSDGRPRCTLDTDQEDEVYGLESLPSNLAVGAGDTLQLWDVAKETCLKRETCIKSPNGIVFGGHRNPDQKSYIFSMARKGDVLVAAVSDGTVRLNDARTLESVDSVDLHARRGNSAYAVAASATAPLIASADQRGSVLLWDMRHLEAPVAECANPGAVHALAFVDDLVVSAGADGRLRAHASKDLTVEASASVPNSILCVKADRIGASRRRAARARPSPTRASSSGAWPSRVVRRRLTGWRRRAGEAEEARWGLCGPLLSMASTPVHVGTEAEAEASYARRSHLPGPYAGPNLVRRSPS